MGDLIDFIYSLPDWSKTQENANKIAAELTKNDKEPFLTEEEKSQKILELRNHYWMLNCEPVNYLPI